MTGADVKMQFPISIPALAGFSPSVTRSGVRPEAGTILAMGFRLDLSCRRGHVRGTEIADDGDSGPEVDGIKSYTG